MKRAAVVILPLIALIGFVLLKQTPPSSEPSKDNSLSKSQQEAIQETEPKIPTERLQQVPAEILARNPELQLREAEKQIREQIGDIDALQNAILAAQEKWGPGLELKNAIIDLFRDSNVPLQELLSFLENSSDQTIIGHAFAGIIQRFNDPSLQMLTDAGDISALIHANFHGMTFGDVLDAYINAPHLAEDKAARLNEAFDILNNANFDASPLLVPEIFKGLARNLSAEETPVFLGKLVESKFSFFDDPEIQKSVLGSLKGDSSIAALQYLSDYSDLDDDAKWYLSRNAVRFSTSRLKDYVESHPADLVAKAAYAQDLLKNGYPEMLKQLLHEEGFGERPVYGKRLGGQLWTYEARIVSAEAKKNPEKVVLEMAQGTSQFDNLHLVTAVNEWMRTDGEAAARWVETEGVNLPPEDRQFVAISYAREAANQGDIELANQWADLILDENRKARVMHHIASRR